MTMTIERLNERLCYNQDKNNDLGLLCFSYTQVASISREGRRNYLRTFVDCSVRSMICSIDRVGRFA